MVAFTSQPQLVAIKPRLEPSGRTRSASKLLITVVVLPQLAMPADDRDAMGRRGVAFYERELSLKKGVTEFERVFREAVTG